MREHVVFAGNARYGAGGQGEFLRQMAVTLGGRADATVYARDPGRLANGIAVPRGATARATLRLLRSVPGLRGRDDWATLIDDRDFDAGVARRLGRVSLFDGIMGQCATSAASAKRGGAAVVLTSLNTHIDALAEVLDRERERASASAPSFVHPAMQQRARREIALADWIRVPSSRAAESFASRGVDAGRIHVIRPAVDLTHFKPVPLPKGAFRVLAVASIDLRKGAHYLLEAFSTARIANAELELIGGTGSRWARAMLERYMRAHANITLRQADVMKEPAAGTYGRASILVHAAVEDGYGLVVPQALACGRPVIVSDAAGASDLVTDGVNGFVVPSGSAAAIREKLELLGADPVLLRRMAEQASGSVAHLGYDAFSEAVLAFYGKVAA